MTMDRGYPPFPQKLFDALYADPPQSYETVVSQLSSEEKKRLVALAPAFKELVSAVEAGVIDEIIAGSTDYEDIFKLVRARKRSKLTEEGLTELVQKFGIHWHEVGQKPNPLAHQYDTGKAKTALLTDGMTQSEADGWMTRHSEKPLGEIVLGMKDDKRAEVHPLEVALERGSK